MTDAVLSPGLTEHDRDLALGVVEVPRDERGRPTEVTTLGRQPTVAEYQREIASSIAATLYDIEKTIRLLFPLGKPATPLAGLQSWYPWQEEYFSLFNAERRQRGYVPDGPKVAALCLTIGSGKGAGKTLLMAMTKWAIMVTSPYAQGIATATTNEQLDERLWSHVISLYECSPLLQSMFMVNTLRSWHREHVKDWKCVATVPAAHNVESLQGVHGIYTSFAVGDECSGIPDRNFEALDGMFVDPQVFQVFASNPLYRKGVWYNRTYGVDRRDWGHTTESFESDPLIVDVSKLPNANHAYFDKQVKRHGWNSKYVRVNIRGLPPRADSDSLMDPETIELAAERPLDTEDGLSLVNPEAPLLCGVDLPAGGDDRFVACFRKDIDARSVRPIIIPGRINSFKVVVKRCERILEGEWNGDEVHKLFLDMSNWGGPAYEMLCDLGWRRFLIPVRYKGTAPDSACANQRAYMYRECSEWMESGGRILDDDILKEELGAQRVDHDAKLFQLVEKKIIKEEIGRSPDWSDALAETFAERVRPVDRRSRRRARRLPLRARQSASRRFIVSDKGWQG